MPAANKLYVERKYIQIQAAMKVAGLVVMGCWPTIAGL
jgi:hypothetical protein